jgi:hypothetical protein
MSFNLKICVCLSPSHLNPCKLKKMKPINRFLNRVFTFPLRLSHTPSAPPTQFPVSPENCSCLPQIPHADTQNAWSLVLRPILMFSRSSPHLLCEWLCASCPMPICTLALTSCWPMPICALALTSCCKLTTRACEPHSPHPTSCWKWRW